MPGVRIVTDSACDLSVAETDALNIAVVPLSIRFGDDEFVDRTELTPVKFYEIMAARDELPETAAPSPGAFEVEFRKAADDGCDAVVCINLSGDLSATGQAARAAANSLTDVIPVECIDSKSVTIGLGTIVNEAATMAADGAAAATITARVKDLSDRMHVIAILDTLDNLKKGGRIGNAQALLGTMLSIKPCIDVSSGVVEEAGKQRTRKKALAWLKETVGAAGDIEQLAVGHAQATDIDAFMADLGGAVDTSGARVGLIGPVIGAHAGPGVIGIAYVTK